ncbi:MAG: hypothetical protein SWJ54_03170 [Cyanobacteriota bacterium]|nr:hypothetical protein [Cyanobacteriota bacterium]
MSEKIKSKLNEHILSIENLMNNLDVNNDEFWSSDSESMARYIDDQVGISKDYDCEIDWSLIETIFSTPTPTPKFNTLNKLLKLVTAILD